MLFDQPRTGAIVDLHEIFVSVPRERSGASRGHEYPPELPQPSAPGSHALVGCKWNTHHGIIGDMRIKTNVLRLAALLLACCGFNVPAKSAAPQTVKFQSLDARTELVAYLFAPDGPGPHPAIVMLHGRGGPYSRLKRGTYTAETLTMRHRMWGEFWAARGYLALHIDSFGPRGYPDGFPKHSYKDRPTAVSEQLVRPLDAYAALGYLRSRAD